MPSQYKTRGRCQSSHRGWGFTFVGGNVERAEPSKKTSVTDTTFPLCEAQVGDRLWVVESIGGTRSHEVHVGDELHVINLTKSGSVIVEIGGDRIGLCARRTQSTLVSRDPKVTADLQPLRDLKVGSRGRIFSYDCSRKGYRKRLLAMGLTPGTEFKVTRYAPLGDPIEIQVRGFNLSLRKDDADALVVESVR
ncbi:MAG: ferrous iron transport protein A [Cyanobacteria bacterium SID2]|nr:ferrous iron transport protein A [Cyanobacteria bacterium SID2]MBP0004813.1 ferrous iron transport protein A [Cyanobacteria bacterium SBC]